MNTKTQTLQDAFRFYDLVEAFLEPSVIGELCRKGKKVFYAFYDNYNLYYEAPSKIAVAYKLADFYQNR
ncbi:MAG: hypothetical protein EB057_05195 [Microbacteriaceae bacterium]|nr:hypothetical protein [Microbacteriaceae bacterium]